MPRVTDDHRAARREQILEAAVRCVAREGFHKTTMAHVISESGLSAGAVYGYFKGKPELIRAIADRAVGTLADELEQIARGPGPITVPGVLDTLLGELDARSAASDGAFPRVGIHAWSEAARDEETRDLVAGQIDRLHAGWVQVVERVVADGGLPATTEPAVLARAVLGLLPGYVLQGCLLGLVDRETYLRGTRSLMGYDGP